MGVCSTAAHYKHPSTSAHNYFPDPRLASVDERPLGFTIIACDGIVETLKEALIETRLQHLYTLELEGGLVRNGCV